jgi:hypothetical protein
MKKVATSDIAVREDVPRAASASAARTLFSLPLLLGVLVFVFGLASRSKRLDDPDTMLHVVIGRWILAHHAVPHADIFTYTVAGKAWVAHEWLGGVISALCYDAAGFQGLVAMASLGLAVSIAIFARALLRYYQPAQTIVIACLAWIVLTPHWLARPHIVALPFLVLWMAMLVAAREEKRAPSLWAALLMIPWVNIHGTFLVGIGFAGLFTVEAVLMTSGEAARLKAAKDWTVFCIAAVAASLVTPNGIEAYLLPLRLLHMTFTLSVLIEWKSIDFQHMTTLEIWLLITLATVLWRGISLPFVRVMLLLLLFAMSLQHVRNGDLIAFIAPLIAGPWAGAQLGRGRKADWLDRFARPASARGLLLGAIVVCVAEAVAAQFPLGPMAKYAPAAALDAVEEAHITGPVLNDYNFGDYLIFEGVKTFIDGRADLFGDPFIKRYYEAVHGQSDELPDILKQYHVTWTILTTGSRAVALMDHMAGWHRLYGDTTAVVHVRDDEGATKAPNGPVDK